MEIDIKKVLGETPSNAFDAIDLMLKAQQQVIEAIFIMQSCLDNPDEEMKSYHETRMKQFLNQFTKP